MTPSRTHGCRRARPPGDLRRWDSPRRRLSYVRLLSGVLHNRPVHFESFRDVVESSTPYVLKRLGRLGVPERDVEDVAQDVFVAVYRSFGTYDHNRPLKPWIYGVAFHVATNYLARAQNQREELADEEPDRVDSAPDPEGVVAARQARRVVARALRELDVRRGVVLAMHDFDEIPVAEVATALGIAESTVKKRLLTARREFDGVLRRMTREGYACVGAVPVALPVLFKAARSAADLADIDGVHVWKRVQGALRSTGGGQSALTGAHLVLCGAVLLGIGGVAGVIGAPFLRPPSPPPSEQKTPTDAGAPPFPGPDPQPLIAHGPASEAGTVPDVASRVREKPDLMDGADGSRPATSDASADSDAVPAHSAR